MDAPQKRLAQVAQFRSSLEKVVDLGYAHDRCEHGILVMFDGIVREAVPSEDIQKLPFKLPAELLQGHSTYAHLLALCTQLVYYLEHKVAEAEGKPRDLILFPFMTALGLSGGVFLLAFHAARITYTVLQNTLSG